MDSIQCSILLLSSDCSPHSSFLVTKFTRDQASFCWWFQLHCSDRFVKNKEWWTWLFLNFNKIFARAFGLPNKCFHVLWEVMVNVKFITFIILIVFVIVSIIVIQYVITKSSFLMPPRLCSPPPLFIIIIDALSLVFCETMS